MSLESAKDFIEKAQEDRELQEQVKDANSEEKFFAVVKEAGFDFTKEEWLAVVPKESEGELSEADLEQAAGGYDHQTVWATHFLRDHANNKCLCINW